MPRDALSTAARGYGSAHQQLRRSVGEIVATGRAYCVRCGERLVPGEPWDLGHDDDDRSKYSGPEHRACNRATAGRRSVVREQNLQPERFSRVW